MPNFDDIKRDAEASGKNVVVTADGQVSESSAADPAAAGSCVVYYTDCTTKLRERVTLGSGETFIYGDWEGGRCVRKEHRCP